MPEMASDIARLHTLLSSEASLLVCYGADWLASAGSLQAMLDQVAATQPDWCAVWADVTTLESIPYIDSMPQLPTWAVYDQARLLGTCSGELTVLQVLDFLGEMQSTAKQGSMVSEIS